MPKPYRELIEAEAKRAEDDLSSIRGRALTVVTTSSGVITLLTGLITFAASKAEKDKGVPDAVIVFIGIAFIGFLVAAGLALWTNSAVDVDKPDADDLFTATQAGHWSAHTEVEEERQVAETLAVYLKSLESSVDSAGRRLNRAIGCQITALLFASLAGLIAAVSING